MKYFASPRETLRLDAVTRPQLRGEFVELTDGVTHYELTGPTTKDVVVLTGGLTVPLFYWDALVPVLHSCGLRTLAFSGYGRGFSTRIHGTYDEALFVRQLDELRVALGLRVPLHLVGTSMGALVAAAYALEHRETLATLTFIGPAGLARRMLPPHRLLRSDRLASAVARRWGSRLLEGHLGHNVRDPHRAEELKTMVLEAFRYEGSLHAFFDTLQHVPLFGRADLYRCAGALGVPTLLLWGAHDSVTPVTQLAHARALLRPVECHIVEDSGHMAPFDRPAEVGSHLARFVGAAASNGAQHEQR